MISYIELVKYCMKRNSRQGNNFSYNTFVPKDPFFSEMRLLSDHFLGIVAYNDFIDAWRLAGVRN